MNVTGTQGSGGSVRLGCLGGLGGASPPCATMQFALEVANTLGVLDFYLDPKFHKCYCLTCFPEAKRRWESGPHAQRRSVTPPFGAASLALRLDPKYEHLGVWKDWYACYHGTGDGSVYGTYNTLNSILECGLLQPGDLDSRGLTVHATKSSPNNPVEWKSQIFTTPSFKYACHPLYARPFPFAGTSQYFADVNAQVILRVLQRPSDTKQEGTHTLTETFQDPDLGTDRVEWMERRRGCHVVRAILIKPSRPLDQLPNEILSMGVELFLLMTDNDFMGKQAFSLLKKALRLDPCSKACVYLAFCHEYGIGTKIDKKKSAALIHHGLVHGDAVCNQMVLRTNRVDLACPLSIHVHAISCDSLYWLRGAAQQRVIMSELVLAARTGDRSAVENIARRGLADAQFQMGVWCGDTEEAMHWFQLAANQNHASALSHMARLALLLDFPAGKLNLTAIKRAWSFDGENKLVNRIKRCWERHERRTRVVCVDRILSLCDPKERARATSRLIFRSLAWSLPGFSLTVGACSTKERITW